MLSFFRRHGLTVFTGIVLLFSVMTVTIALFLRSSAALDVQLRETLRVAALTTALSIDGDDLDAIHGPDDMNNAEYVTLVTRLRDVVDQVPQIQFAYILRRTDTEHVLEFVVDADAAAPIFVLDRNGNGEIDADEEASFPGERYDVSDIPALQNEAFLRPTTDEDVTVDQWGPLLSGYAPIYSWSTGDVVGVVGIDMDAAEFRSLTRSALSPLAVVFIVILAALLAAGIALLVESRQLQTISRVNNERSGLLQLTFHQLGEPITILQWGIETLEDAKGDPALLQRIIPENLIDMREGVRRLGSIIDTLQEAEKVELHALENKPVSLPVKRVLEDIVALVMPVSSVEPKRILLDADDVTFVLDPHLLTILLRRIMENALDFSPAMSPVRVRAMMEGKWLRIDVIDTGCGIPTKDQSRLFEKYHRASNAHTMKPDGNGLGLYIAKGLVELMGGTMKVVSIEGSGTTVTVRLPHRTAERG